MWKVVARPTDVQSAAITALCIYEAVAILSAGSRIPTVSAGLKALPVPARTATVAAAATWLTVHVEIVRLRRPHADP